jgi:AcrR family transcriptional regulator
VIVDAARRLIAAQGGAFTTQDLVKEAGVALQTFYRYFEGKDQLLLAVFEDLISEAAATLDQQARELPNPVDRLRYYVTTLLGATRIDLTAPDPGAQFVTAEHWRLHQSYPREIAAATQPITDLIERDLRLAADEGLLSPHDPAQDAWFTMRLVMSVFHHYAFVERDEHAGNTAEDVWAYCLAAFGGGTGLSAI